MRLVLSVVGVGIAVGIIAWANWPVDPLPVGATADRVVVEKKARRLTLLRGELVLRHYSVSLGRVPVGPKEKEGDLKTPEGVYRITEHKHDSSYHRALRVSYPEEGDRRRASEQGVQAGSDIMVHGLRNGLGWVGRLHRLVDWTAGCVALTDDEIDQVFAAVPNGAAIEIRP